MSNKRLLTACTSRNVCELCYLVAFDVTSRHYSENKIIPVENKADANNVYIDKTRQQGCIRAIYEKENHCEPISVVLLSHQIEIQMFPGRSSMRIKEF